MVFFKEIKYQKSKIFGKISDSFKKSYFKKIVVCINIWGKNIMKLDIVFTFSVTLKSDLPP